MMKKITKRYCVAGHYFSLTLPDSQSLWDRLGQYAPFAAGPESGTSVDFETSSKSEPGTSHKTDTAKDLFVFEWVDELPVTERTTVLKSEPQEGFTSIDLFRSGTDWLFEFTLPSDKKAEMLASDDFSCARFCTYTTNDPSAVPLLNYALMMLYAFASCPFGTLEIHASVVRNDGRAYLFLGKSGTGKSTHSRQWLENIPGTELMNDDNPVIRVLEDGTVMAYGSPWSGKTPCFKNVEAPVGAFVKIRQSKDNKATAMNLLEAYATIYSSSSGLKGETRFADHIHPTFEKIVTGVPFFYMDCRPDREAAEICHEAVCR